MMNDQAFYFFQQNGQIGVSYAGQAIHLGFDEVYHGRCCSAGELNPQQYDRMVDFFALKGQTWYFVEAVLK
jgi:hypothetical protein